MEKRMLPLQHPIIVNLIAKQLPKGLQHSLRLLPQRFSFTALETVLNWIFSEALAHGELDYLINKSVEVCFTDLNYRYAVTLEHGRIKIERPGLSDTVFKGKFNNFVLLAGQQVDPDTLFFNRLLELSGDTELGLEVKATLENLDRSRLPGSLNSLLEQHCQLIQHQGALK